MTKCLSVMKKGYSFPKMLEEDTWEKKRETRGNKLGRLRLGVDKHQGRCPFKSSLYHQETILSQAFWSGKSIKLCSAFPHTLLSF